MISIARGGAVSPREARQALLTLLRPPFNLSSWPGNKPPSRALEIMVYYAGRAATVDFELSSESLEWLAGRGPWAPLAQRLQMHARR